MTARARMAKALLPADVRETLRVLADVPERMNALAAEVRALRESAPVPAAVPPEPEGSLRPHEYRTYSQNGEDGILLYLFTMIGTTSRTFAEIGVEDGRECNTANLSLNFGWRGVLVERDADEVERARSFYGEALGDERGRVCIVQQHVTAENVNDTLTSAGLSGEIDLLSVDVDGNDYWIWDAVDVVRPRLVTVEYNASLGYEVPRVVPYDPNFSRFDAHSSGFYHGASIAALVKLGNAKGYCLVGCDSSGVNAFFVRRDTTAGRLSEVPVHLAWRPMYGRAHLGTTAEQFEQIRDLPFVDV